MTNVPLATTDLTPIPRLRQAADEWLQGLPAEVRKAFDNRSTASIALGLHTAWKKRDRYTAALESSHTNLTQSQQAAWRKLLYTAVSRGDAYVVQELGEAG